MSYDLKSLIEIFYDQYLREEDGDQKQEIQQLDLNNDKYITYIGIIEEEKFEICGILYNQDGSIYFGEFQNGLYHGQGTLVYPNKDKYEGSFEYGLKNGKGNFYTSSTHTAFNDFWVNDKRLDSGPIGEIDQDMSELKVDQSVRDFPQQDKFELEEINPYTIQQQLVEENQEILNHFRKEFIIDDLGHYYPGVRRIIINKNDVFEGEFLAKKLDGRGLYVFQETQDFYVGEWKDNKFNGRGIYCFSNGERYEGDFQNGMKQGEGKYLYMNGDHYNGPWFKDRKNGYGILNSISNNQILKCNWENGKKTGTGQIYDLNGQNIKTVQFDQESNIRKEKIKIIDYQNNNSPQPKHKFEIFMEKKQKSSVKKQKLERLQNEDLKRENQQIIDEFRKKYLEDPTKKIRKIKLKNNASYNGEVLNKIPHGKGIFMFETGDIYVGEFISGICQGKGIYIFGNGERYEGNFEQNLKNGQGLYYYFDKSIYSGEWKNDKRNGEGEYKNVTKQQIYQGQWKNGLRHGNGKLIGFDSELLFQGEYENDMPIKAQK